MTVLPLAVPSGQRPDVLLAEAWQVQPGDEVVYTEGEQHVAVRPSQVQADPAADTVTLIPRGRDEYRLPRAHRVIIIRNSPAT
jgi:hypothetical protein